MGKKVVAIVQARTGSTRLPGKVLKQVCGKPLLQIQLERVLQGKSLHGVIIATTDAPEDDAMASFGFPVFRGSTEDVLDRFYHAAKQAHAEVVVRLTADCPLIDPAVIDEVVQCLGSYDYASNVQERTFPRGMDVEAFTFEALEKAALLANQPYEREHVTPYIYQHPDLFKIQSVTRFPNDSHHRWTVDTAEDLELITKILESLYPKFTLNDILQLLKKHPEWEKINNHIEQKKLHD